MSTEMIVESGESVENQVRRTREAARTLARLPGKSREELLWAAAQEFEKRGPEILDANVIDCEAIADAVANGTVSSVAARRLKTSHAGIREMASRIRDVAS